MMKLKLQQFAAPGSTSALRDETFENLQLNVGIFVKNFAYENLADADEVLEAIAAEIQSGENLLGATRGGGTFNVSREMRTPQIDGLRYRFKGGNFVDSSDPYISTTLVETTPENFAIALGAELTTSGKKQTLKMPTALIDEAYLDNLCWVGDLADGRVVLIRLDNALNTANFTFTFTDKSEGTTAVEFHACQDSVLDYDYAPFEVVFFGTDENPGTLGSLTVSSSAGTNVGDTEISVSGYTLGDNDVYAYKVGNSAPEVSYHQTLDFSWSEWDGESDIAVGASADGKKITVAVVDGDGQAIYAGSATLAVKTA